MAADDVWQIILGMCPSRSRSGSSSAIGVPILAELGGQWVHCMSSSLLCGGPDAAADVTLANR
jgi:hypothetical protein